MVLRVASGWRSKILSRFHSVFALMCWPPLVDGKEPGRLLVHGSAVCAVTQVVGKEGDQWFRDWGWLAAKGDGQAVDVGMDLVGLKRGQLADGCAIEQEDERGDPGSQVDRRLPR